MNSVPAKPVTFRTLDIGGDKVLPYMRANDEENPALGWRAIRIGLDRPGLLRAQLRAMMKAASDQHLRIMFPMVATVKEFDRASAIVERERKHLQTYGYRLPKSIKLGVMVEVPSLLFEIDELAARADFMSVGSNDLMQFFFAADRENPMMADRFDPRRLMQVGMVMFMSASTGWGVLMLMGVPSRVGLPYCIVTEMSLVFGSSSHVKC